MPRSARRRSSRATPTSQASQQQQAAASSQSSQPVASQESRGHSDTSGGEASDRDGARDTSPPPPPSPAHMELTARHHYTSSSDATSAAMQASAGRAVVGSLSHGVTSRAAALHAEADALRVHLERLESQYAEYKARAQARLESEPRTASVDGIEARQAAILRSEEALRISAAALEVNRRALAAQTAAYEARIRQLDTETRARVAAAQQIGGGTAFARVMRREMEDLKVQTAIASGEVHKPVFAPGTKITQPMIDRILSDAREGGPAAVRIALMQAQNQRKSIEKARPGRLAELAAAHAHLKQVKVDLAAAKRLPPTSMTPPDSPTAAPTRRAPSVATHFEALVRFDIIAQTAKRGLCPDCMIAERPAAEARVHQMIADRRRHKAADQEAAEAEETKEQEEEAKESQAEARAAGHDERKVA